jgi:thioesterase domain-containing protein
MDADDCMRILSNLIPHVGPDQPLCGLRPRWLDGRSPSYSSVAEVTAEFMADLRAFQPRGPYYLVGDCVQGVVAVEMARTLMEQGDEVALLVLLDSERPRFHSFFLTGTARLWDRGRHIAQVLRQFVRPTEGTRRQVMSDLVQRKLRRASLGKNPITATDDIYVKRVGYGQLLRRHRLKRYAGRITLILTDKVYRIIGFLGWKGFAEGGLEVYRTPGDHETFRGEYSRELGQRLRLCIDRAQSESEQRRANAAMGTPPHAVQKPE